MHQEEQVNQLAQKINKKIYYPIYLLNGDEPYYIDKLSDFIEQKVLTDSEKPFNQTIIYGKETTANNISDAAKRYPMMASNQVIIVKEAQEVKDINELHYYAENPLNSTVLVLCYKYKLLDKRSKLYKAIQKKGAIIESKRLRDYEVPEWIEKFFRKRKIKIYPEGSQLLTDFLGNDLAKIENELNKLMITLPEGESSVTPSHIEKNIGISKDFNTFELTKALGMRNIFKTFQIVKYFGENQKNNPFQLILTSLFKYFSNLLKYHFLPNKTDNKQLAASLGVHPFFIKEYQMAARNYSKKKLLQIIQLLREYDLKSKGIGNVSCSEKEILRELIIKIVY